MLPQQDAVVRLATQSHHVLLFFFGTECDSKELFALVIHLLISLRYYFLPFAVLQVVDCALGPDLAPFADGQELLGWRESYEVDALCALAPRDELLRNFFGVEDDNVVACDVEQLLVVVDEETVLDLAVDSKNKLGRQCNALQT
jgi:hypothetical protein